MQTLTHKCRTRYSGITAAITCSLFAFVQYPYILCCEPSRKCQFYRLNLVFFFILSSDHKWFQLIEVKSIVHIGLIYIKAFECSQVSVPMLMVYNIFLTKAKIGGRLPGTFACRGLLTL